MTFSVWENSVNQVELNVFINNFGKYKKGRKYMCIFKDTAMMLKCMECRCPVYTTLSWEKKKNKQNQPTFSLKTSEENLFACIKFHGNGYKWVHRIFLMSLMRAGPGLLSGGFIFIFIFTLVSVNFHCYHTNSSSLARRLFQS